jgi:hypothetical protein
MTLGTSGGFERVGGTERRSARGPTNRAVRPRDHTALAGFNTPADGLVAVGVRVQRASRTPSTPLDPLRPVGGEPRGAGSAVPVVIPAAASRLARRVIWSSGAATLGARVRAGRCGRQQPPDLLVRHRGERGDPAQPPTFLLGSRHPRRQRRGGHRIQRRPQLGHQPKPNRRGQRDQLAAEPLDVCSQERHPVGVHAAQADRPHPGVNGCDSNPGFLLRSYSNAIPIRGRSHRMRGITSHERHVNQRDVRDGTSAGPRAVPTR